MSSTKFLCRSEQLIEGEFIELQSDDDGRPLFLVGTRYQGQPRIWMNSCPHQGRPLNWAPNRVLNDEEGRLVCAAHGAVFELEGGRCVSGPCQNAELRSIDLIENEGEVHFIGKQSAESNSSPKNKMLSITSTSSPSNPQAGPWPPSTGCCAAGVHSHPPPSKAAPSSPLPV